MILYNVTIKVDNAILTEWLEWIQTHMLEVVATGCFQSHSFYELLDPKIDEHRTFVVQYRATNLEDYHRYIDEFAGKMREDGINRFGDQVAVFRSLMNKLSN